MSTGNRQNPGMNMTSEITKEYEWEIAGDRYEIFRVSFDGIRESRGFKRPVRMQRPQYKFNGKVVPRATFFALKSAAEAES